MADTCLYTGRRRALQNFVDGRLIEGDLDIIREVIVEVLDEDVQDNLRGEDQFIGHFRDALELELYPTKGTESPNTLPEEIQELAEETVAKVIREVFEQLSDKFDLDHKKTEEIRSLGDRVVIDDLVEIVGETLMIADIDKVISGLDPTIRSYVANAFRKAGVIPVN